MSLRGGQRPTWQSREGSHVDRTRHCRGADSRARRRTYSPYKPPSKWQTLTICHCEAPKGSWQSREGSYDFADNLPVIRPGTARLPRRFAPRNDKSENLAPLNLCHDHCRSAWRSLSAATDAIGRCVFIDTFFRIHSFPCPAPTANSPARRKKAPIFRSELHVGVTYLPVQSPAKYCRRK